MSKAYRKRTSLNYSHQWMTNAPAVAKIMFSADRLLLSPVRPFTVTPRFSAIAEPSTPVSATGVSIAFCVLTVIASVLFALSLHDALPIFSVAATVSVKLVAFAGVIVSADRFQL